MMIMNMMTSSFCVIYLYKRHLCCEDPVVVMNMWRMAPGPATLHPWAPQIYLSVTRDLGSYSDVWIFTHGRENIHD